MSKEILTAQEFQLKDKKGKIRARLALTETGEPFFCLYDSNQEPKATFGITEDEPKIVLFAQEKQPSLLLGIKQTRPVILLAREKAMLNFIITEQNHIGIEAYDPKKNIRLRIYADEESTEFILSDQNDIKRISLMVNKEGIALVGLSAPQEQPKIALAIDENNPKLMLIDKNANAFGFCINVEKSGQIILKLEDTFSTK